MAWLSRRWRSPSTSRRPRSAAAVFAAAVILLLGRAAHLWSPYLLVDDAFISFRYADNLARGLGLVYNAGERVEGYTNFLWTLLLAGGAAVGIQLPLLSVVLAAAAGVATLWVLHRLAQDVLPDRRLLAVLPPLLYAATGSQPRFVISGMETLLFALLVLWAAELAVVRGRMAAAGAVFALAAMTRPEGGMYWLLATACVAWRGSCADAEAGALSSTETVGREADGTARAHLRRAARLAAVFVALYLPYFLWRFLYYGWLLPNTFYVKGSGFTWSRVERGAGMLVELGVWWSVWPLLVLALVGAVAVVRRAAVARSGLARCGQLWLIAGTYILATVAYFLWAGGDFLIFFGPRFLLPALPFLLLFAAAGLGAVADGVARVAGPRVARAGAGLVGVALLVNAFWLSAPPRLERLEGLAMELEAWTRLAHWLDANVPAEAVIATGGAGIVPYYTRRTTIDMYGLADAHIAHLPPLKQGFRAVAHEKYAPGYVLDRHPDFIVSGLDERGRAQTAGLRRVAQRMETCYRLWVVLKVRGARPEEDGWVVPTRRFRRDLFADGYQTAVFRRRQQPAQCRP